MENNHDTSSLRCAIRLQGGIGNQIFQLALGAYLGCDAGLQISYLTDSFDNDGYNRSNVSKFIFPHLKYATLAEVAASGSAGLLNERSLSGLLHSIPLKQIMQAQGYSTCVLDGYWQDTRYVTTDFIERVQVVLNRHLSELKLEGAVENLLSSSNALAIHVRRHDYKHHGICDESYYVDSIRWMREEYSNIELFVFSDEPNYTSYFLRINGIKHQIISTGSDLVDLALMARCHRHVISNSTFSWWGAVLSSSLLTVYPLPWSLIHTPALKLFPDHWIYVQGAVFGLSAGNSYRSQFEGLDK